MNVSAVLEGSVRKQGDRIKIDAQITSVKDGYQVWSQQFDRNLTDVFAIQEEIAQAITERLKINYLQHEGAEMGAGHTQSAAAHDAVLKARYFWNRRELKESEKYFKQAIELDPGYAAAYAGLAETYVIFPFFHTGSPDDAMPMAEEAAKRAIQLDSLLSGPYATLAYKNALYDLNQALAKKYFVKALQLNPNSPQVHYWYGQYLNSYESCDLGIAEMQRAVELEPQGSVAYFNLGISLVCAEKFKEAVTALKTSVELNKQFAYPYAFLGHAYRGLGQLDEARRAYERATELSNEVAMVALVYLNVKDHQMTKATELFEGLEKQKQSGYWSKLSLALGSYYLGQKDRAFAYFANALETHDIQLSGFLNRPYTIPLGKEFLSEPACKSLVEKHLKTMRESQVQ